LRYNAQAEIYRDEKTLRCKFKKMKCDSKRVTAERKLRPTGGGPPRIYSLAQEKLAELFSAAPSFHGLTGGIDLLERDEQITEGVNDTPVSAPVSVSLKLPQQQSGVVQLTNRIEQHQLSAVHESEGAQSPSAGVCMLGSSQQRNLHSTSVDCTQSSVSSRSETRAGSERRVREVHATDELQQYVFRRQLHVLNEQEQLIRQQSEEALVNTELLQLKLAYFKHKLASKNLQTIVGNVNVDATETDSEMRT
jgi:hypothetical protein